ncbi:MAG: hypothetical protein M1820_003485 [Bogoriella megaspora]|nr:MAG: hypothetical protein M1820_003485 [Bogoriella megaspora]
MERPSEVFLSPSRPDAPEIHDDRKNFTLQNANRPRRLSETDTEVPRRNLKVADVAALILNKMLDEIYKVPEMLATVLYAGVFIALANTAGNALAFAKLVLVAYQHTEPAVDPKFDPALVRTLAISIVTLICFLHYTWNRLGLFLNKAFALYKIMLCLVVFVAGVRAWNNDSLRMAGEKFGESYPGNTNALSALIVIFYSYEGWENATYVAGEIAALRASPGRSTSSATLRKGAMLAVVLVTMLYFLVALGYVQPFCRLPIMTGKTDLTSQYAACRYTDITDPANDIGMATHFAYQVFGSTYGLSIAFAMSAVGNLIAVIYTYSKVKQSIALQRILPFWRFLQKDRENPRGALVLQWVATTIWIVACPITADGYTFVIGIYEYARVLFIVFITAGFLYLHRRMEKGWQPELWLLRPFWPRLIFVLLFIGLNMLVVVYGPKQRRGDGQFSIDRRWWPSISFMLLAGSFLYWFALTIPQRKISGRTIGQSLGFEVTVYRGADPSETWPIYMRGSMVEAREDGTGRRVGYKASTTDECVGA